MAMNVKPYAIRLVVEDGTTYWYHGKNFGIPQFNTQICVLDTKYFFRCYVKKSTAEKIAKELKRIYSFIYADKNFNIQVVDCRNL